MRINIIITVVIMTLLCLSSSQTVAYEYQGNVGLGYIYTDIEGNQSVHQPTHNLYDGASFSLEKFRIKWDNGTRLNANIINPNLNNRRLDLSINRSGFGGATVRHSSYRRTYDFEGTDFTRRKATSGTVWLYPVKMLKLFAGYGITDKDGDRRDLFEPSEDVLIAPVDYTHQNYHAGLEIKHHRSYGRFEYRVSDFSDDLNDTNNRSSQRLRMTVYSPMPMYENISFGGGFQRFEYKLENRSETLKSNTAWGVGQYMHPKGYQIRYSFMFDRTNRTGDLAATDNIRQTVHIGKTWKGSGGLLAGYGHAINDDIRVERSGNEYSFSGWLTPVKKLTLRSGLGFAKDEIQSGRTLTGNRDYSRYWFLAHYRFTDGFARLRLDNRQRDNDDIGSSIDYIRLTADISHTIFDYGDIRTSYSFGDGKYTNSSGVFDFQEHVLSGDAFSKEYLGAQVGFGGNYYRSRQDEDVKAFTIQITGRYRIFRKTQLEVIYSVHNFDDFNDTTIPYNKYNTANVVEARIIFEMKSED
ncbi:MAG: hypothetical protein GY855_16890 [candidate division Zixibacteria bacterium]|nr:hypothetical protein [candidate division Zixibacteria bacterium]